MTFRYQLLIALTVVSLSGGLVGVALHYHGKYLDEQQRANTATEDARSANTITSNVLRIVAITNLVLETNQHAKQQIALESQRAESDIKVAVADDDCANQPVPAGAVKRLQQYADSLRNGAASPTTSKPDR